MNSRNIVIRYGAFSAAIIVSLMVLSFWGMESGKLSLGTGEILGFLSMFLGFSMIYAAIHKIRETQYNGTIPFKKAFQIGISITLIVTVIYVAIWLTYSLSNDSQFLTDYYAPQFEKINESTLTEIEKSEGIQDLQEELEFMKKPIIQVATTAMEIFPIGLLVTLVSGYILSRNNKKTA